MEVRDSSSGRTPYGPFPADLASLYGLAAAVVVPALPVVLAQIPLAVVVMDLIKTLR